MRLRCNLVIMEKTEVDKIAGWFAGRLPDGWFTGAPSVTVDEKQILVVGTLAEPGLGGEASAEAKAGAEAGRIARVNMKAGRVCIAKPRHGAASDPATVTLTYLEVSEANPPAGCKPIIWRLLTTLPVAGELDEFAAAQEIVRLYRLRWRIEQVFRAMKSDGLRLENTQVTEAERLFKLAAIALTAAARTIQLVDARDGGPRPASDVADQDLVRAANAIGPTLEGNTARQKNPHEPGSLAWLAWIVARLGGWNCYYKPPGPKTMRSGWNKLAAMAAGYAVAMAQQNA